MTIPNKSLLPLLRIANKKGEGGAQSGTPLFRWSVREWKTERTPYHVEWKTMGTAVSDPDLATSVADWHAMDGWCGEYSPRDGNQAFL